VSGSGAILAEHAMAGKIAIRGVIALVAARFVLTMVSYGSGAAGGIFAPLLVIGALGGLAVGSAAHLIAPTWAGHPEVFAVLGMGALLTSHRARAANRNRAHGRADRRIQLHAAAPRKLFRGLRRAEAMNDVPIYEVLRTRAKQRGGSGAELRGFQGAMPPLPEEKTTLYGRL